MKDYCKRRGQSLWEQEEACYCNVEDTPQRTHHEICKGLKGQAEKNFFFNRENRGSLERTMHGEVECAGDR